MKLYCYSDFTTPAWAKNPAHWRELTGINKHPLRCAHSNWPAPEGWHKPNGHLANDAIEKTPTVKDLINALTPWTLRVLQIGCSQRRIRQLPQVQSRLRKVWRILGSLQRQRPQRGLFQARQAGECLLLSTLWNDFLKWNPNSSPSTSSEHGESKVDSNPLASSPPRKASACCKSGNRIGRKRNLKSDRDSQGLRSFYCYNYVTDNAYILIIPLQFNPVRLWCEHSKR